MQQPQQAKTNKVEESKLCRIHLKIESVIYVILGFIIGLPILCISFSIVALKKLLVSIIWLWEHVIQHIFEWLGIAIIWMFAAIAKILSWIVKFIIKIIRWTWDILKNLNWCAIRSISRSATVIGTVVSLVFIVKGFIDYPVSIIITGKLYDANETIMIMHILMCYVLFNIVIYYFLWILTPEAETEAVCKYTKGWSNWLSVFKK